MAQARSGWGRGLALAAAVVAVAGAFGVTAELLAGKPGGGGGGGGTTNPPDIAYVERTNVDDLYVMQDDGTGQTLILGGMNKCGRASWSPDGTRLAFASDVQGLGIYTIGRDGTGLTKVAEISRIIDYEGPSWSPRAAPGGQFKIAFSDVGVSGRSDVYLVNTDGTGRMNVTNSSSGESVPWWSPEADEIRCAASGGIHTIQLSAPDGQLVAGPSTLVYAGRATFPDGARTKDSVAFISTDLDEGRGTSSWWDVFVVDLTAPVGATNPRKATDTDGYNEAWPCFSPDDTEIVCRGGGGIARVNVSTGVQTTIARSSKGRMLMFPVWRR